MLMIITVIVLGAMAIDTCVFPFDFFAKSDRFRMKFYTMFWGVLAPVSVLFFGQEAQDAAALFGALSIWSVYNWQPRARHM